MQSALRTRQTGYSESLLTEKATNAALVRLVDCLYDGSDLYGAQDSGTLRWRTAPQRFKVSCRLGPQGGFVEFGQLMFLPAGVPYAIRELCGGDRSRNLLIKFSPDMERRLVAGFGEWSPQQLNDCYSIQCGRAQATIQRLQHELENPGFADDTLIESLLTSLAVDVGRYFKREVPANDQDFGWRRALSSAQLRRVTEFIHAARGGCPTSGQLAQICDMNPSSFRHRFKLATGMSVHAFVESQQLERAQHLLVNTEMLMKEISYELGFTHQATFTSSFRRLTGICPIEYRRKHLG